MGLSLSDAALLALWPWVPHRHSDNGTNQFLEKFLEYFIRVRATMMILSIKLNNFGSIWFLNDLF